MHTASVSVPGCSSIASAIRRNETSADTGLPLRWISKIFDIVSLSGTGIWVRRSIRPGIMSAGSTISIRLVAEITNTTTSDSSYSLSAPIRIREAGRSDAEVRLGRMDELIREMCGVCNRGYRGSSDPRLQVLNIRKQTGQNQSITYIASIAVAKQ